MTTALDSLTDKEKETLRLLLRGHDAKSSARELDLSVHTINERLRAARRKLEVTSSREAARLLLESEGETPETSVPKPLGDADQPESDESRWARHSFVWATGVIAMIGLTIAASLFILQPNAADTPLVAEIDAAEIERVERAASAQSVARAFLEKIDQQDWEGSYAATSDRFQAANTVKQWAAASRMVYTPLGQLVERGEATVRFVNAPPNGYQEVAFASRFTDREAVVERVTLEKVDGQWKLVGILLD